MAMKMKRMFAERGYKFFINSPTNQQFIIINNDEVERISKKIIFTHWGPADDNNTICRFVTS
jgi:threonine aldolase